MRIARIQPRNFGDGGGCGFIFPSDWRTSLETSKASSLTAGRLTTETLIECLSKVYLPERVIDSGLVLMHHGSERIGWKGSARVMALHDC